MNCTKCGKYPIENKKYELCRFCMHEKRHGTTIQEKQSAQQKKWLDGLRNKIKRDNDIEEEVTRAYPIKKNTQTIKRQTKKESKIKSALYEVKREIELEAVQNDSYYCCGCGKAYLGLDKSHILSVSLHKTLELVKENIQLLCREDHIIWESGLISERLKLHCFIDNIVFIYFYHEETCRKVLTELTEYIRWMDEVVDEKQINEVNNIISQIQERIIQAGGELMY